MLSLRLHAFASLCVALAASAAAQASPPADVTLAKAVFAGAGCPAAAGGSARLEGSAIVLDVPVLAAELSGGKRLARTVCSATLEIHHPAGWQLKATTLDLAALSSLPPGAKGDVTVTLHTQGSPGDATGRRDFAGEAATAPYTLPLSEQWSPCDGKSHTTLVLAVAAKVIGPRPGAMGRVETKGPHRLKLEWKKCQK